MEETEKSYDYFNNFIRECLRDLRDTGKTYVFTKEQIKEIKKYYPEVTIRETKTVYYLELGKEKQYDF